MKDFQKWNIQKNKLQTKIRRIYFHRREIWWCSLGLNIGFEQDGKNKNFERPILILKVFNSDILWGVPLTSNSKIGKYYYQLEYNGKKYSVILSQLRVISSKRLLRKIRTLNWSNFNNVRKLIKSLI